VTKPTLVVDASVAIAASHSPVGFAALRRFRLVAPQLLWFEAPSVMHEMAWRGQISGEHAGAMLGRLLASPIKAATPAGLTQMAWDLADRMGWAKTYDAHYVALADHLGCKLLTLDERLIRGIARLGLAVRPRDL
jgi:predicted nucleic acid-binding protein